MPEPVGTIQQGVDHTQLMRQKMQESTKSISEVIQELMETLRQKGEIPSSQ